MLADKFFLGSGLVGASDLFFYRRILGLGLAIITLIFRWNLGSGLANKFFILEKRVRLANIFFYF